MNRLVKTVAGGLFVSAVAFGSVGVHAQTAPTVVREGVVIGALGAIRTSLPEVESEYGLKFEFKDFNDSTAALRALAQGELDIANTTSQHLVRAITEGIDVVWVVGATGGNNVLVARKELKLPTQDSKALKKLIDERKNSGDPLAVAVPTGSMQHAKLVTYLEQADIDADKDVRIVNVGFPNHPRALEAGEVDLAMTLAPFGALAMEKNGATVVEHLYGGPYGKHEIGFIVNKKLIETNPELVQSIVDAHVAAMKKFVGDKDQQVAYEMKYSRFPESVVDKTERDFLSYSWRTNVGDLKTMAREMTALGWAKEDVSSQLDDAVDLNFLSKATGEPVDTLSKW